MKTTYDEWAVKFGNLKHTNIDPYTGEFFELDKQISECNLTKEEIQSCVTWWRGIEFNRQARENPIGTLTPDPYYEIPTNKPVFSDSSTVVITTEAELEAELAEVRKQYPNAVRTPWGIYKGSKIVATNTIDLAQVMAKLVEIEKKIDAIGWIVVGLG